MCEAHANNMYGANTADWRAAAEARKARHPTAGRCGRRLISVRRISRGIACRTPVPRRQAVVLWMHVLRTCGAGGRCSLSIVVAAGLPQVPHVPLYPVTVACLVGRLWVRAEGVPKRPLFGGYVSLHARFALVGRSALRRGPSYPPLRPHVGLSGTRRGPLYPPPLRGTP